MMLFPSCSNLHTFLKFILFFVIFLKRRMSFWLRLFCIIIIIIRGSIHMHFMFAIQIYLTKLLHFLLISYSSINLSLFSFRVYSFIICRFLMMIFQYFWVKFFMFINWLSLYNGLFMVDLMNLLNSLMPYMSRIIFMIVDFSIFMRPVNDISLMWRIMILEWNLVKLLSMLFLF